MKSRVVLIVCFCVAVFGLCATPQHAALPRALSGGEPMPSLMPSLAPMIEASTPGVVNIATYASVSVTNPLLQDPFFRRFFNVPERRSRRLQSAGSGVIVDAEGGYIVTNSHVVDRADEINVTLADGRTLPAKLIGSDPQVDLAVLGVKSDGLTALPFADSSALRVGDFVVAIGNPFGLEQTVTSGIISALGRSGLGIEGYEDFIQTDASINPGNSGGALVDLNGAVVGINTAIIAPGGGNVGIGFAIPSNIVTVIMRELIDHGEVRRGRIGLNVATLNPDLAAAFGTGRIGGVVVMDVEPGSVADSAGLRTGDVITHLANRAVRKVGDYSSQAAVTMIGDVLEVDVVRDNKTRRYRVVMKDDVVARVDGDRLDDRLDGAVFNDFRDESDPKGGGVLVSEVDVNGSAYRYGLEDGDVIVAANRRRIRDVGDLWRAFKADSVLRLRIYRSGQYGVLSIR